MSDNRTLTIALGVGRFENRPGNKLITTLGTYFARPAICCISRFCASDGVITGAISVTSA